MNVIGKSREQIATLTRNASRSELIDLIYSLATLEPMFTPAEIASRRKLSKRKVVELMKSGVIAAHKPLANGWRAKLSAVQAWDEQTAIHKSNSQQFADAMHSVLVGDRTAEALLGH